MFRNNFYKRHVSQMMYHWRSLTKKNFCSILVHCESALVSVYDWSNMLQSCLSLSIGGCLGKEDISSVESTHISKVAIQLQGKYLFNSFTFDTQFIFSAFFS